MATIRRDIRPRHHFTQIRNDVLRDQRLSFRARGILAYILSLPDGESFTATTLQNQAKEGRDAVLAALRELRSAGYLHTITERTKRGKFTKVNIVTDEPSQAPAEPERRPAQNVGNPKSTEVGFSDVGKPDHHIVTGIPIAINEEPLSNRKNSGSDRDDASVANELVTTAWERVKHDTGKAPVWSFIGVRKLVEAQLRSGAASPDELAVVLPTMTAVTINTLAIALAKYRDTPESRSARNRAAASRRLAELEAQEAAWRSGINA